MKTCTLTLRKLFVFAVFLITSLNVKAGGGDPPTVPLVNWGNYMLNAVDGGLCVAMEEDNVVYLDLRVRLGANDVTPYPDIFVQYNFGDIVVGVTEAITNAQLSPVMIDGNQYYEAEFNFTINLVDQCEVKGDTTWVLEPVSMDYEYTVVTFGAFTPPGAPASTFDYYPYPVANHPQLFPVGWFAETSNGGSEPSYSGTKPICCHIPGYTGMVINQDEVDAIAHTEVETTGEVLGGNELNVLQNPVVKTGKVATSTFKAFPNPVLNELNLQFTVAEEGPSYIEILDHQGRLIRSEQYFSTSRGEQWMRISTADLSAGIYYVQLRNRESSEVQKIVKLHE
ncbi:MAG: T9SS type A sorting domain-containing protein [Bacteroidota bacterium]